MRAGRAMRVASERTLVHCMELRANGDLLGAEGGSQIWGLKAGTVRKKGLTPPPPQEPFSAHAMPHIPLSKCRGSRIPSPACFAPFFL